MWRRVVRPVQPVFESDVVSVGEALAGIDSMQQGVSWVMCRHPSPVATYLVVGRVAAGPVWAGEQGGCGCRDGDERPGFEVCDGSTGGWRW
jgi:hypothetical protein